MFWLFPFAGVVALAGTEIYASLPGLATILPARILGEFGDALV